MIKRELFDVHGVLPDLEQMTSEAAIPADIQSWHKTANKNGGPGEESYINKLLLRNQDWRQHS